MLTFDAVVAECDRPDRLESRAGGDATNAEVSGIVASMCERR
ncbi:MAG: hypothetical protein V5A39_12525 [Haloarculaceae archaeon]